MKVTIHFVPEIQVQAGVTGPVFENADVNYNDAGTALIVEAPSKDNPEQSVLYVYPLHTIARVKIEDY